VKTRGKIFVISGPSGSGKTTLIKGVLKDKRLKKKLVRSISFTTRPVRPVEKHKSDYFFISQAEFKRALRAKKILEWTKYLGYYYGTPKDFVDGHLNKLDGILLCLDVVGARKVKKIYPGNTVTIFVLPPSLDTLPKRIKQRCCGTDREEIKKRIQAAKEEIAASRKYDYKIVNRDLGLALKELKGIIIKETGN
jgi:guanylate kinase